MFRAFLTSDESTAWDSPSVDSASSLGGVEGGVRNSSGGVNVHAYQSNTLQYTVNYKKQVRTSFTRKKENQAWQTSRDWLL